MLNRFVVYRVGSIVSTLRFFDAVLSLIWYDSGVLIRDDWVQISYFRICVVMSTSLGEVTVMLAIEEVT